MALFEYKAVRKNGDIITDSIQAASREAAAQAIAVDGLEALTIKEVKKTIKIIPQKSISSADKANLCRFMATMLRSGISIPEAVDIIRQESDNKRLKEILADVAARTRRGESLHSIFSQYKDAFDLIFLTIVKVGEESGNLEKSFDYLARQLYASHELTQKIKGALMYPSVILAAMSGIGMLLMVGVLPKISQVFSKMQISIPPTTRIILGFGSFVGTHTPLVIGSFLGVALLLGLAAKVRTSREVLSGFVVRLPMVKKMVKQIDVARFARTLATLLKSGVPIITALNVSAEGLTQKSMKELAKKFSDEVGKGSSLSEVLSRNKGVFPVIMTQTVKAGEKSGTLEKILEEMADFYEKETEQNLKRMVDLLEPILILVIGIAVGGMVIMMIAPIYSIVGGLQQSIQK